MSILLMPNHSSWHHQARNWMLAQMTNTYPPPPQPDGQHYNPLYPTSATSPQLMDSDQQGQLPYSGLSQSIFKTDSSTSNHADSNQHIQNLAQELQQRAALGEHQRQQLQQTAHHLQPQSGAINHPLAPAPTPQTPGQSESQDQAQKANRLRKACDSCSIRKVKCDENTPCKACSALDIPCTFERPSRRRGPPNRHAEAIKRRRLEDGAGIDASQLTGASSPSSPLHAAQALTKLSSQPQHECTAESLFLPIETLELLIDDFFAYIHPLCPFPHEPSFREQWRLREDRNNPGFLALLASMVGALVASFPRVPRQRLKAQGRESVFPNHISFVKRCQDVCAAARGPGYLDRDDLNVYDAATSYFLALMSVYTFRWRQGRLYFGECLTILRALGLHKAQESGFAQGDSTTGAFGAQGAEVETDQDQPVNYINLEMARRIFWTMFVSVRSMEQLGGRFNELYMPPATRSEPYPPLPVEVDDFLIYPTHIEAQPAGSVPLISGFNANVRVYSSYTTLTTLEAAWGADSLVDWDRQQRVLYESLQSCKNSLANLPAELIVNAQGGLGTSQAPPDQTNGFYPSFSQSQPPPSTIDTSLVAESQSPPDQRRRSRYEIQKSNFYVSSILTRSYIVEKYWNLHEAHERSQGQASNSAANSPSRGVTAAGIDRLYPPLLPDAYYQDVEKEMRLERETILNDLFVVIGSIEQVNMEPNAHSITMKIRAIAGTLIEQPDQRRSPLPPQVQEHLSTFLAILEKLERVTPANSADGGPGGSADEEEAEFRTWADLREYQMDFARKGGLMGMS